MAACRGGVWTIRGPTKTPWQSGGRSRPSGLAATVPYLLAAACLTAGCGFYGDPCHKQISECLARCDRADHGGEHVDTMPRDTRSSCERNCHRCAPEPEPAPDPSATPTPTGGANGRE